MKTTFEFDGNKYAFSKVTRVRKIGKQQLYDWRKGEYKMTPRWEFLVDFGNHHTIAFNNYMEAQINAKRNQFIADWQKVLEVNSDKAKV